MDPLLHPRRRNSQNNRLHQVNQLIYYAEEREDRKIGRKSDGHSFLKCTRYNSYRLLSVVANDQWRLLLALLDRFNNILKKNPHLVKKKVLFHQMGSHVPGIDGQIQQIPLRIASSSSIFARFSSLRLFPASKPEEMIRRKEIHHQRATHRRNRGLFEELDKSYYSNGLKKLENRWSKYIELKKDYVEK